MATAEQIAAYDALCAWSLGLADAAFVHQHVVDAWAAQTAQGDDKPIRLAFALAGLQLKLEAGFDGRAVQRAHMALARLPRDWPAFSPASAAARMNVTDVLRAAGDAARIAAVDDWCAAVWASYEAQQSAIRTWLAPHAASLLAARLKARAAASHHPSAAPRR